MKTRSANCPACGGPVQFRASNSLVTICEFCHSVVARGDKSPEEHGKVADLVELQSPIMLGMRGKYQNKGFEVVGRVQYKHPSGATWNEWYLLFPGDVWGWLAEAQSRFYMMFEKRLRAGTALPSYEKVELGQNFDLMKANLAVTEKAIAHVHSAEGEIPWAVRPGIEHRYADLRSESGAIATLDFGSESPTVYVGQAIALKDLQLTGNDGMMRSDSIPVQSLQINCPKCAGPLTLHAPDDTLRVVCPNCSALLDADHGKLKYLETLAHRQVKPVIPLSAKGVLFGDEYVAIGFMERYVMYEGKAYSWTEYLLYNKERGFRWLVCSSDHWSFVEPIDFAGTKVMAAEIKHLGRSFKKYDQGTAYVRYVVGEFPWRVTIGETVECTDYISPPNMLSFEHSIQITAESILKNANSNAPQSVASEEINVSLGTYLPVYELEKAFKLEGVKMPWSVGPIQPAPGGGYQFWWTNAIFILFLFLTQIGFGILHPNKAPDIVFLVISIGVVSLIPIGVLIYKHSFEVKRWENSDYSPYSQE
jgi:Domain of unknown function (DUF4178)